jgi:hypothetical protein
MFENVFESVPSNNAYRLLRITPIPRLSDMMTANVESGAGDEYTFIDVKGMQSGTAFG